MPQDLTAPEVESPEAPPPVRIPDAQIAPSLPVRRRNNPGNIKDSNGQIINYAKPEDGWEALYTDLRAKTTGRSRWGLVPQSTILELANVYAPVNENKPADWANNVAFKLGVPVDTPIGTYANRIEELARAVDFAEHGGGPSSAPRRTAAGFDAEGLLSEIGHGPASALPPPNRRTFMQELLRRTINPKREPVSISEGYIPFTVFAPERTPGEGPGMAAYKGLVGESLKVLEDFTSPASVLLSVASFGLPILGGASKQMAATIAASPKIQTGIKAAKTAVLSYFALEGAQKLGENGTKALDAVRQGNYEEAAHLAGKSVPDVVTTGLMALAAAHSWRPIKAGEGMQQLRSEWVDRYAAMEDLEKLSEAYRAIPERSGMVISAQEQQAIQQARTAFREKSAYMGARRFAGVFGKIQGAMDDLRTIVKPMDEQGLLEDTKKFMTLERYQELGNRLPNYTLPGGQTLADAQVELSTLRNSLGGRLPQVEQYAGQLRQWQDGILDRLQKSGVFSQAQVTMMRADNEKYIPLYRAAYMFDEFDKLPSGAKVFDVKRQTAVRKIQEGSEQDIADPLYSMIRNGYKGIVLAEQNDVAKKMAAWSQDPNLRNAIRLKRNTPLAPGEGSFSVIENGVVKKYVAPQPVVEAMKGMQGNQPNFAEKVIGATNRFMKAGATTYYAPFLLTNATRDALMASLRSEVGFTPVDWMKGLYTSAMGLTVGNAEFDRYMRSGAAFAGFFEKPPGATKVAERLLESDWQRATGIRGVGSLIGSPFRAARALGEMVELIPRTGVFRKALATGLPEEEAAFLAREVTTDFSRMGTKMQAMNNIIPFLNPRLQGSLNIFKGVANNPAKAAAILGASVFAPGLYTYLNNVTKYPKVWDQISSYTKNNNFISIYGDRQNSDGDFTDVYMVPMGEVGRMFWGPTQRALEWMYRRKPGSMHDIAANVLSEASPIPFTGNLPGQTWSWDRVMSSATPPILKSLLLEPMWNKNLFTQIPIYPAGHPNDRLAGRPEEYKLHTPEWAIKMGHQLDVSPAWIQNFVTDNLGGLGRLLSMPVDERKRDEMMERTGAGKLMRMFTVAPGRGEEEILFSELGIDSPEARNNVLRANRKAQALYEDFEFLQPAEQKDWWKTMVGNPAGLDTPEVLTAFIGRFTKGITDPTRYEAVLAQAPSEVRAMAMERQKRNLSPAAYAALQSDWAVKGIYTEDVAGKMVIREIQRNKGTGLLVPQGKFDAEGLLREIGHR